MESTMKKTILLIAILTIFVNYFTISQKPEKVYSFVKILKPFDWYKEQSLLWKKEIKKDKHNPEAWQNYYTANRMASRTNYEEYYKEIGKSFEDLDSIIEKCSKIIPNTFEYYYLKYYHVGISYENSEKYIKKAYEIDSNRVEVFDNYLGLSIIKNDKNNIEKFAKKWYNSNDISPNILNYNYNVLNSLDSNAIIFTNGDNDTEPIWVLQNALNVRKDVLVINVSLILIDKYRDELFKRINIKEFKLDTAGHEHWNNYQLKIAEQIITHIIKCAIERPVYFAMTLSDEYYEDIKEKLFIIGLSLKYSEKDFDNIAVLRDNYENKYLLDYLKFNFINDPSKDIVEQMNIGYIAGIIKLVEHYKITGDIKRYNDIKNIALTILRKSIYGKEYLKYFE